jgi:hypothetical protein
MEEPAERLIRRALGQWPPPTPGPTLTDDVLRRVAEERQPEDGRRAAARRWLAASWLVAAGASLEVLAHLPWTEGTRAVAWGLALALVPLGYSAALWPGRALGLLVLCGRPLLGEPREGPHAVSPGSTSRRSGQAPR